MPTDDLTTLSWMLKNVYGNAIEEQRNTAAHFWDKMLSKAPEKPRGNGFYMSANFKGNQAVGAQNAREALRQAQVPEGAQPYVQAKVYTGSVELTGLTKETAITDPASFAAAWDYDIMDMLRNFRKILNIDSYGDGSGKLGLTNGAVSASTTVTMDTVQPIQENMLLDIYDNTNTTRQAANVKVSSVQLFDRTFTADAAITVDDNAVVYPAGMKVNAPTGGKAIAGLGWLIDTNTVSATLQGVNRTNNPIYQATVIAAGSVNLSNDLLQRLYNRRRIRCGNAASEKLVLLSHLSQGRKYLDLAVPLKRFTKMTADMGFTTLEWNGRPWVFDDVDAPEDTVYMMDSSDIQKFIIRDIGMDDTGGSTVKWLPGYDCAFAFAKCYLNLGIRQPRLHAKISGLATPSI